MQFISCSVRGVFSSLFCDCGPEFTVVDPTGEEPAQSFIASISQVLPHLSHFLHCVSPHLSEILHSLGVGSKT